MIFGNFGFQGGGMTTVGGLTYLGTWDALTNNPTLTSGVGICGGYYIVSVAGTTNLDGVTDWQIGDWAIFECDSNQWQKIDNHDIVAYNTIQEDGVSLPPQQVLDFQGAGVSVANGVGKTVVTILGNIPTTNYGLYSQTADSIPVTATITEGSLIGVGQGGLSVPENGFQVGNSFQVEMGGFLSAKNGDNLRIRVKTNYGAVLADSGLQTLNASTNDVFKMSISFTVRNIGASTVAMIQSSGVFNTIKQSNGALTGFAFNSENSTTFDTTILNTLEVTAEWSSNSPLNSIYTTTFVLTKTY